MKYLFFLILLFSSVYAQQAKILYTAALLENNFETRKQEYIHSINILKEFGYKPYIVESCNKSGPTFFDEYSSHVCYAGTNDPTLRNKGVNEVLSLLAAFGEYDFNDDDMIIKLTGRYFFENDLFLKFVEKNKKYDAIVSRDTRRQIFDRDIVPIVFTGCFAMKYKYLKRMLEQLDLEKMERNIDKILEREVTKYLFSFVQKGGTVVYLDKLHLTANIAFPGQDRLTHW